MTLIRCLIWDLSQCVSSLDRIRVNTCYSQPAYIFSFSCLHGFCTWHHCRKLTPKSTWSWELSNWLPTWGKTTEAQCTDRKRSACPPTQLAPSQCQQVFSLQVPKYMKAIVVDGDVARPCRCSLLSNVYVSKFRYNDGFSYNATALWSHWCLSWLVSILAVLEMRHPVVKLICI